MIYRLIQTVKPLIEPVTLTEAKSHLRLDTAVDDTLVQSLIETARQICENFTERSFIKQTFSMFIDKFPDSGIVVLPRLPFLSLLDIKVYDAADVGVSEDLASYSIDSIQGRVVLKEGSVFPVPTRKVNGIEFSYDAGYGASTTDVPDALKQAILMVLTILYEHRGDDEQGQNVLIRSGALNILQPYRKMEI